MLSRLSLIVIALLVSLALSDDEDKDNCQTWADRGECESEIVPNRNFMLDKCKSACDKYYKEMEEASKEAIDAKSFFDLSAKDIDGNLVKFDEFRGKVTVVTNVASECGYTESHYKDLVDLWSQLKHKNVEILAFPCNQFGEQEPGTADEIKKFAKDKGVEFRMMEKVNVNGSEASLVFKYLKKEARMTKIGWNFSTYFLVGTDGKVEARHNVMPLHLKKGILKQLAKDEL